MLFTFYLSPFTFSYAETPDYAAPSELPGVRPEMLTAGYWIAKHPFPDKLIMNPSQVARFNAKSVSDGLIENLAESPLRYDGAKLKKDITKIIDDLKSRTLYQENALLADAAFYGPLAENMGLTTIPVSVDVRFGFIVAQADERLLPTNFALTENPGGVDFDQLQNSGIEIGTPVVVLHSTEDSRWLFVKDAIATGWVEAEKVVLVSKDEFTRHLRRRDIVVVTEPRADIFLDREMVRHFAAVRMGTRFVLKNVAGRVVEVLVPERTEDGPATFRSCFIAREDVTIGYLPFTPRTVLRQAFRMLGAPYGWGDVQGRQDCSRFIQMVFATVGIELPRNSGEQAKAGTALAEFPETTPVVDKTKPTPPLVMEKTTLLSTKAMGGLTLLRLKGHIMLYLGMAYDRYFAIHATWGYHEPVVGGGERTRVLKGVVVTDLSVGEGSTKGSLLDRLLSVRILQ